MIQTIRVANAAAAANQNEATTRLLAYMRDMLQELHMMAPAEAGDLLPYLIDMAREEAATAEKRLAFAGF